MNNICSIVLLKSKKRSTLKLGWSCCVSHIMRILSFVNTSILQSENTDKVLFDRKKGETAPQEYFQLTHQ